MTTIRQILCFLGLCSWMACISDEPTPQKTNGPLATINNEKPTNAVTDSTQFTTIRWMDSVKTMAAIKEGQKLEVVYRFTNTGTKPLVIESASPSCGCTVPEKPEKPIMPGAEGQIKAVFDSQGKAGSNHKTISVKANTFPSQNHTLEFNVEVKASSKDGKPDVSSAFGN